MPNLNNFGWMLVFLLFCFTNQTFAQSHEIDSIKKVIKNAPHDTIRIRSTVELNKEMLHHSPDSVIPLCQSIIAEIDRLLPSSNSAVSNSLLYSKALALSNIGYMFMLQGQHTETFNVWNQSVEIREKIGEKKGLAGLFSNIGLLHGNQGDYKKEIFFLLKGLKIAEETNNKETIFNIQHNLGALYMNLGQLDKALSLYQDNLTQQLKEDLPLALAHSYKDIGNVYSHPRYQDTSCSKSSTDCLREHCLKGLEYYNKSLVAMEKHDPFEAAEILFRIGDIYQLIGDPTMPDSLEDSHKEGNKIAMKYYTESLDIYTKYKDIEGTATILIRMNEIYHQQQHFDKALDALKRAQEVLSDIKYPHFNESLYYWHYKNYVEQKKYKEALDMFQNFVEVKDTLYNENLQQTLLQAEKEYNHSKKVLADSLQLEKEKEVYTLQIQNQKTQKTYLVVVLVLILIFVFFIWNQFRKSKKQNAIIEQANKDLGRQHVLNQKIFSTISHDFRGPILSLQYVLTALEKENKPEQINQYIQTLHQELDTSTGMLNNLLNWAKTEIGLKNVENFTANVLQLTLETEQELKQKLNEKKLALRFEIPKDAVLQIPPDILRITLRNLLSNAIKFSYPEASIDIHYDVEQASLSIKDYGKGIDAAKIQALFKQEVETDLGTFNEEGFGMGLYIVSELLYKYNFQITVQGELDQGSLFVIRPQIK